MMTLGYEQGVLIYQCQFLFCTQMLSVNWIHFYICWPTFVCNQKYYFIVIKLWYLVNQNSFLVLCHKPITTLDANRGLRMSSCMSTVSISVFVCRNLSSFKIDISIHDVRFRRFRPWKTTTWLITMTN